ncbi:proliferation marker protein Ki-67 isoform X2 [Elephas maximus indicus]|uniref:proliferation marker protein Ki-67 isoform X2 n=1 Tax=Elephas maximus indicus TaxID=99487 RepID=UPI002116787D|nr:proliferation marker protein Ki-67 isoform X2 [Elephas maximus indicus]
MRPLGRLVIIRRTGSDGTHFPLCRNTCLFGRGIECDIRIQLPVVSQQHCKIDIQEQEALLINFSTTNPTQLNGAPVNDPVKLKHGDIITIIDRSFRFESGSFPEGSNSTEYPEILHKKETVRQVGDATDSEKLSSEKKASIPTNANTPPQSMDTDLHQQKFPARVLSQMERKTLNASPRKPQIRPGYPEVISSHASSTDDPMSDIIENKNEEMSFKRRRVSFGGSLRPELFDENLPPNTPVKRGETPGKRKSLGIPAPTVLKKIMREQSLAPEKGEPSSTVLSEAKSSSGSNSSKSQRPNTPKRRSDKIPFRRKSVDKNTLQIVFPKRRSSTSKGKLPGGKSWADVVKLGAKKQQTKNVKQDSQRHISKKQRRKHTPQKPLDHIENPFSTGHANSPCTVIIGRAHVDKVNAPARPYRMLNTFVLNKKITYTEDLSGLSEMFKTPGKEKPHRSNVCPDSIKKSETVFEEAKLGEKPETLDVIDKILLPTKQEVEVEDISQKLSKQRLAPGETLAALKTQPKAPNVSPELVEDLCSKKDRTPIPESPRKSISGDVLRKIWKTTKCTPESNEMPRMSPRLWRNPCASLELAEDLAGIKDQTPTLKSLGESISNEEFHIEIKKTPKHTPKSGQTSRKSLRLLRTPGASPELMEHPASMKDQMPILESPEESSGDDHKKIQKTPKRTSKSGETPKMSLSLLRNPNISPELVEDLAGIKDQTPTPKSLGKSISNEEVHTETRITPKRTPKSEEMSRKSLRLLRNPSASPELVEDLGSMKDQMPTLESPGESSGDDHRKTRKTPKRTSESEETPRTSLSLLRNPSASAELVEDLAGIKDQTPTPKSLGESVSNEEVHGEIQKTPKRTPKSGETSRKSLRLLRSPSASPELMGDLASRKDQMPTPESPGESSGDDHTKIQKTPKRPPKSGEISRKSLSLLRNPSASPELMEDLASMKDQTIPESPGESSGDDHKKIQKTPKRPPKSGETPRMSLSLLRDPNVSPELAEDLAGIKDETPTLKSLGESINNEEAHREIRKAPKWTPKSGETSRMSLRLQRNPSASPELVEDLTSMKDQMPTPESPGESISADDHSKIRKTPKRTFKSGEMPRMSLRLLRDPTANPELVEDLSRMIAPTPTLESPAESIHDEDVHREIEKTPKWTQKTAETPKMSLSLLRNPSARQELVEDLASIKVQMPTLESPGESISGDDHRKIRKTPKCTPKSGEMPRMSLTLLRDPSATSELMEDLSGMIAPMPTLESPGKSVSGEEVHREIRKAPKHPAESGETPRMSLRLLRNPSASPELLEDLAGTKDHMPTPKSPGQSISNEEVHREIRKTPKRPVESGETPRMSPRLWRNPSASPKVMEGLSGMSDHTPTPKSPGESISNEEVHREIRKTPKCTPKSRETPRMSLSLLRSLSTSPELGEDLASMKAQTPTLESPGESISGDDCRKIQKTPKGTPRSGERPRMSPRLCKDPSAIPELVEDLASMKDHMPTPAEPDELVKQKPESLVSPTGKSLLRPPLKIKPESVEALTMNLLKTPPQTVQGEYQAANMKLGAAPREVPEYLRSVRKHLRNSTKKTAPVEEPTDIKTPVRTPKRSYEWMGNLSGLKSLMMTPRVHPEDCTDIAKFPTESDPGVLTIPEELQESLLPERPVLKESPVEGLGLSKLMEVDSTACEETSDSATKNKDGPGDSQENPSCNNPCEDESRTNASEKLWPTNMKDSGINQRTRYGLRNKRGREVQESKYLPHQTEKVESESNEKTTEPNIQTNLHQGTSLRSRHRCKTDTEVPESQLLPSPETIQENKGEKKTLKSSQKKTSEDGPMEKKAVALRSRGRSKTGINLPETESLASLAEVMHTEEDDKPMESSQEKIKPTGEEKIVLTSRKKINSNFGLVTRSNKVFPAKVEESDVSSSTAARVSVSKNEEKTVTHSLDKVFTKKVATRGLRSRSGPATTNPASEVSPSPLSTTETADSEEAGRTQGRKHQKKCKKTRVKTRHQSMSLGEETQHSHSLPAPSEEASTEKETVLKQETCVKTRHQRKGLGEETQHSHSLPAPSEEASTEKETALKQETNMKTRHQRKGLGEEMQHSCSLPAICEEASTEKETALKQETSVKTRRQRKGLGEETQHSHSLPAPSEEASTEKETALKQETRVKTRRQRKGLGEETQHSHSLPALSEEASTEKETALKQETSVKTRHQRKGLGEETQHSHSLPALSEEASTEKETALKQETNMKTRHQRKGLGEEMQHSCSLPAPSEEASTEKETALKQETSVKTRRQRKGLGEETQHSHSLPAPSEEASTEKETALKQETRVKTRRQRKGLGEETQHSHSLPALSEEASTEKETALKQETSVKTRHQRKGLGEETQHSHSLPALSEEASTEKETALKQETNMKTRHQRKGLGEEMQHSCSLPAPSEEASTEKETALKQETRLKTGHQRKGLGEEMQHSHSLPAPSEEASTEKETALKQETSVKTRHQRKGLGEAIQHFHSLPAPSEEASTEKETVLKQETRLKTGHQRKGLGEEMQHFRSLPAICEEASTEKETALKQETSVKTRHQRKGLGEETQHSHSLPAICEEASTEKETALKQETRVKTGHQRKGLGEEMQHSCSLPAPSEEASTEKETALKQETSVKTRHQRKGLGEAIQHSHSLPAPSEEPSTEKETALKQETRLKTGHQRKGLGEEMQHFRSLPAICEEASKEKETALKQETSVKTRRQRKGLGEETQHSHSLPAICEEASTEKETALKQETRVKTGHQRKGLGEEMQHFRSLPAPCEEASTEKETALKQETSVKTRRQGTRLGEETQHSRCLPAICEEASTDKDEEDRRLLNHTIPPQKGRGLRSRSRNKVSTDPEGLLSIASSTETKRTEEATEMPVKTSHQQEAAAATEAALGLRSGRRNKVPVTTPKMQGSDPEPSTENTSEKAADDPSGKVSEDPVTVPGIQSSRLRSRNQTKSEAELCSKEKPTKKPSHSQSDMKSLQKVTRASKRGIFEEAATKNPKQLSLLPPSAVT